MDKCYAARSRNSGIGETLWILLRKQCFVLNDETHLGALAWLVVLTFLRDNDSHDNENEAHGDNSTKLQPPSVQVRSYSQCERRLTYAQARSIHFLCSSIWSFLTL